MNINRLTDKELSQYIEPIFLDFPAENYYTEIAKFIRQCVKDSAPTEEEIKNLVNVAQSLCEVMEGKLVRRDKEQIDPKWNHALPDDREIEGK